jgi:prephenate dehydrogenase
MKITTLTIIGVGLIGGSIGLAAKRRGVVERVLGVGRRRAGLDKALALGAIDQAFLDPADAARQSELTVFCTPVDCIARQALAFADDCPAGAVLTDAGSTKAGIVRAMEEGLPSRVSFVGGHPLAGSEKRGPEHADASLFEGRVTVLTRTPATPPAALERISQLWQALGARVRVMTPEDHDRCLAITSHLPHLLASTLAGIVAPDLADLIAGGFRDTTRIAAGDAGLWTAIFSQNRGALLEALDLFSAHLAKYRQALQTDDTAAIHQLWAQAKKVRDALGS